MSWFNIMASLVSLLASPLMCMTDHSAHYGSVVPVARDCRAGAASAWNTKLLMGSLSPHRAPRLITLRLPGSQAGFWLLTPIFLYLGNQSLLQGPASSGRELSLEKAAGKGKAGFPQCYRPRDLLEWYL